MFDFKLFIVKVVGNAFCAYIQCYFFFANSTPQVRTIGEISQIELNNSIRKTIMNRVLFLMTFSNENVLAFCFILSGILY